MRSPGGCGEAKASPTFPLIVALGKHMVKKIINAVVLTLFAVRLLTLHWPSAPADILTLASVVVISVAAGVALSNLLGERRDDNNA